ncbi:unnamed protein product [Onchocerca flexuosa]|uniref:Alternative protein n=1 Tax=Onchocerca flexuosa TaxID=387005 RepID=A0A183I8I5_9BILA|nr:unnamed protein product [Onchocerca flexuosa]
MMMMQPTMKRDFSGVPTMKRDFSGVVYLSRSDHFWVQLQCFH